MNKMEQRFYSLYGERYLKNGKIRCQAASKTRIKYIRGLSEKRTNPNPEPDFKVNSFETWARVQCPQPAIEATFQCHKHGGTSLTVPRKALEDFMPIDLFKKLNILKQDAGRLSNYSEIDMLRTRNAELFQSLHDRPVMSSSAERLRWAITAINSNEFEKAKKEIRSVLEDEKMKQEVWSEFRENTALVDRLRRNQFTTEKDLQTMATADQVNALLARIFNDFTTAVNQLVKDPILKHELYARISHSISQSSGTGTRTDGSTVHEPEPEGDRNTKPVDSEALLYS